MNTNEHWEVIEYCGECGEDNIWEDLDPVACNYETVCQHCGEPIMLCDECYHSDDNPYHDCDWHPGIECKGGICFRRVLTIETYPDYWDEDGNDNYNYDDTLKVFSVPMQWAVDWIQKECEMTFDQFMEEYDWDDTLAMFESAYDNNVLIKEWIEPRSAWGCP